MKKKTHRKQKKIKYLKLSEYETTGHEEGEENSL